MVAGEDRCPCEAVSHGKLGPVENSERLARVALHPIHFKNSGALKPGVFPITQLMEGGLSLTRVDKIDREELEAVIADIAKAAKAAKAKFAEGVLLGRVDAIRALLDESGGRALCATDDPVVGQVGLRDNEAHALVLRSADQADPEIRALRGELLTIFGRVKKTAEVYV